MSRTIISSILIFVLLIVGTILAILYAKGYRFVPLQDGKTVVKGTGILVVTSKPEGAKVFIDDNLSTATNNTLNLFPGSYSIRIEQEGYIPWKKKLEIQKEVVTQADALLIPVAPELGAITLTGASNLAVDPTGSLLAYTVSSASASKNGIYILDLRRNPLIPLGASVTQISDNSIDNFSSASLSFSPDGTELLASISGQFGSRIYQFLTNRGLQSGKLVTNLMPTINKQWEIQKERISQNLLRGLRKQVVDMIQMNFSESYFSPEKDKILYSASESASLPIIIKPRLIGSNSTDEERNIEKGNIYVYDIKEDRNYLIKKAEGQNASSFLWHPDSKHLLYAMNRKIQIMEFDGGNNTTVYAGPFENNFFYPWPDGSRLVILTNLGSSDTPHNLYTVSLD